VVGHVGGHVDHRREDAAEDHSLTMAAACCSSIVGRLLRCKSVMSAFATLSRESLTVRVCSVQKRELAL
jgi:hypothetical protein